MKRPRTQQSSTNEESSTPSFRDGSDISAAVDPGSSFAILSRHRRSSTRNTLPKPMRNGSWLVASVVLVLGFVSVTGLPMADASSGASAGGVMKSGTTMTWTAARVNDYEHASGEQFWDGNARIESLQQHKRRRRRQRRQQQVQLQLQLQQQLQQHRKLKTKRERQSLDEGEDRDGSSDSKSESESDSSTTEDENMIPAGKCMECTFSEQKTYEACRATGKWQKFGRTTESSETFFEMKSCKYTDFDEGFAMFQFQIFCLLIGCLSFMSVRKQRRVSSSIFDRRKQQGASNNNSSNSNSNNSIINGSARSKSSATNGKMSTTRAVEDGCNDDEDEIEFTPMTNQEKERVPLMEIQAEHMEII